MNTTSPIPVFDGHNDVLLKLYLSGETSPEKLFLEGNSKTHIDLPRARAGGFAGGFFAMFPPPVRDGGSSTPAARHDARTQLPPELPRSDALVSTMAMAAILFRLERASDGALTIVRSASDIRSAMSRGTIAALFHIEGAEALDEELDLLQVLHAAGLRSVGPVWSRRNIFAEGVPFRFPSSPDTGPGLSDAGKRLVQVCNRLKILVDLSHINEKGFRDVASLSDAPLVATHSNVHAICPHARNLTQWQLGAIRDSGGMVGLNFATGFLREDGAMNRNTGLEIMVRHVAALVEALGENHVGLGSDFDGAVIPAEIGDVTGLPKLLDALLAHGFGRDLVEKIAWRNWVDVLERTIGQAV